MRSSEGSTRFRRLAGQILVVASLSPVACSTIPAQSQSSAERAAPDCIADDTAGRVRDGEQAAALRRTVEAGPFYTLSSSAGVAACRANQDDESIRLEYRFRDGTTLRVTHNPRIEYSDQELRLSSPLTQDPVTVLTRAERAAFPDKGCGINWQEPETSPAADDAKTSERVYRGDTCNCQARVRRDASGRTIGLLFRSAC